MKTSRHIFMLSAAVLALAACTQNDWTDSSGLPEGKYPLVIEAGGLESVASRATVDGNWEGVTDVALQVGAEVKAYTVSATGANKENAMLSSTAPFYWTSRADITVTAWWPYNAADLSMPEVKVKADQSSLENFKSSDYIYAHSDAVEFEHPTLEFTHRTARLTVTLTPGDGINRVEEATLKFIGLNTEGGNPASITPYHTAGTVVYEALVAPQTIAQGTAFITVTLNGTTYSYVPDAAIELGAGSRYNYTVKVNAKGLELEEVSGGAWTDSNESEVVTSKEILIRYTADEVKKGDYIYQDGTTSDGGLRLIYADGTMVTTPEKPQPKNDDANPVVGIVFWTPSETTPQTDRNTPASLEHDVIMRAEHPDCTHGLAVALKDATYDGSEEIDWQYSYESVADFQGSDNFSHGSKRNFKSIASGKGAGELINYILGYQNTVVLRAYNTYCQNNDKSDYIVKPVAAIDDFNDTNPAPDNSTGWFLPSPKELHILCYKDVDDIDNNKGTYTRDIINSSLTAARGDGLNDAIYWSSGEYKESYGLYAWNVYMYTGFMTYYYKNLNQRTYVRPIFAF